MPSKPNSLSAKTMQKKTSGAPSTMPPPKGPSKAPIIDDDGFITPYPIKEKKPAAKHTSNQKKPAFPDKFAPKKPATTAIQILNSATSSSNKPSNADKRRAQHFRRGPNGEIRIGSGTVRSNSTAKAAGAGARKPAVVPNPDVKLTIPRRFIRWDKNHGLVWVTEDGVAGVAEASASATAAAPTPAEAKEAVPSANTSQTDADADADTKSKGEAKGKGKGRGRSRRRKYTNVPWAAEQGAGEASSSSSDAASSSSSSPSTIFTPDKSARFTDVLRQVAG